MELASQYDVVILGTGLIESILAAAAAFRGKSVLQLDKSTHYGGRWSTLGLKAFLKAVDSSSYGIVRPAEPHSWTIDPTELDGTYAIDLAPSIMFGAGPMVDALLTSGAHHCTEFKLLNTRHMLLPTDGESPAEKVLVPIPANKAEIFSSKQLSLADKRMLMRFLKYLSDATQLSNGVSLADCMQSQGVTRPVLKQVLTHGVLLAEEADRTSLVSALRTLTLLQQSTGRYGPEAGPYLVPLYGTGELTQAFCRTAAVHGAVQILHCRVAELVHETERAVRVAWEDGTSNSLSPRLIRAGIVVGTRSELGEDMPNQTSAKKILRCVAILEAVPESLHQLLLVVPNSDAGEVIWCLLVGPSLKVCPPDRCLLYLWTASTTEGADPEVVLKPALEQLLKTLADQSCANTKADDELGDEPLQTPSVVSAVYYAQWTESDRSLSQGDDDGIVRCPDPGTGILLDNALESARDLYLRHLDDDGQGFPFDPKPAAKDAEEAASDDETIGALEAALGASQNAVLLPQGH